MAVGIRLVFGVQLTMGAALTFPSSAALAHDLWPISSARVERELTMGTPEQRLAAVVELGRLAPGAAHPLVRRFIDDDEPAVRLSLGVLAVSRGYDDFFDVGHDWAQSSVTRERWLAVKLLGARLGPDEVRKIGQLVSDHEEDVRLVAVRTLRAAAPEVAETAADFVLSALDDPVLRVRIQAIQALAALGVRSAVLPLIAQLRDSEGLIRSQAARALAAHADARAVPGLMIALGDSEPNVVAEAASALAVCGDKQAAAGLVEVLRRPMAGEPRLAAWLALAQLDPTTASAQLSALTSHQETQAALLLEAQETRSGIDVDVRDCLAAAVLGELEFCVQLHLARSGSVGPVLNAVSERRLTWEKLFRFLTVTDGRAVEPDLMPALVRAIEVLSLPEYGGAEFASLQEAALSFLLTLRRLPPTVQAPLFEAMRATTSVRRVMGILALLERAGPLTEPERLIPYLEAEQPLLRQAAAQALVVEQPLIEVLTQALYHDYADVRGAAARRLAQGMTAAQIDWALERAALAPLSRDAPIKQALYGAVGVRGLQNPARVLSLWARESGRDRGWIIPAAAAALSVTELRQVLATANALERLLIAQLAASRPDLAAVLRELAAEGDHRLVAMALESLSEVEEAVQGRDYLDRARGRPLFVYAAAVRSLRRLWARRQLAVVPDEVFSIDVCRSKNGGLSTAAWGWAAELGRPCGEQRPEHQLLVHPDARVRSAIASGMDAAQVLTDEQRGALRRCVLLEADPGVARGCSRALLANESTADTPRGGVRPVRARLEVPWMSSTPPAFPFLLGVDTTIKLVVSDEHGMAYVPDRGFVVLDSSLVY